MTRPLLLLLCWLLLSPWVWAEASRDFDGVDDAVNFGSHADLDNQEPFSLLAWIYPDTTGESGVGTIFNKDSGSTGWWYFLLGATNTIQFSKDYTGGGSVDLNRVASDESITLGAWNYVVLTWDGSTTAANVLMYVNGTGTTYKTTTNGVGTKGSDASNSLFSGGYSTGIRTFDGQICYDQFADRVITAVEILEAMWKPDSLGLNLIGFWPIWGSNSPEIDLSASANTGTLTGTTASANGPPVMFGDGLPL